MVVVTPLGEQIWTVIRDPQAERVQRLLAADTPWIPVVLISLMVLHTLVPVPAEILAVGAGMVLGPVWGFVTIWIGAMLGAYLGFWFARTFGQPLVRRLVAPHRLERVQHWLRRIDMPLLLAVRLLPVLSFNLINYALGLTPISWWQFTWTTGVGIVPGTVLMVAFGAHLHDWRMLTIMTVGALLIGGGGYLMLRRRMATHPAQCTTSRPPALRIDE
jgi:uncharacterized membrane protein YdjX (TVP38/TMEM64 family)